MAHIIEFSIGGLAGRNDVYKQKLHRDINIFYGFNGSGKTSLLRILHSAMSGKAEMLQMVPFEWAEVVIYSIDYRKKFERTISKQKNKQKPSVRIPKSTGPSSVNVSGTKRTEDGTFVSDQKRENIEWRAKGLPPDAPGSWKHRYLPTSRLFSGSEYYPHILRQTTIDDIRTIEEMDFLFEKSIEQLWFRYTNNLLSEIQTIQGKGLANLLQGILSTIKSQKKPKPLDAKEAFEHVSAFLSRQGSRASLGSLNRFEKKYINDLQFRKVVNDINAIESKITSAMNSRNRLEQLVLDMFTNKTVIFEDTSIEVKAEGGQKIPLVSLSSGEKHSLRIFIETLLAERGTILIDEPEISMHVDWQNILISAMHKLNQNAQIIVASHSPEIMANVPDENIFHL